MLRGTNGKKHSCDVPDNAGNVGYLPYARVMIAGTGSGCGKTLTACALMRLCVKKGLKVASFKCGPDYIDPMYHRVASGYGIQAMDASGRIAPGGNLDTYFTDPVLTRRLLCEGMSPSADIAVLEGVMGMYDGVGGTKLTGSSYDVAVTTGTPVILTVNGKGTGRSILAMIRGYMDYDTAGLIKGVILNRISGMYYARLKSLIENELKLKVVGYVPEDERLHIDSRHLGLYIPDEEDVSDRIDIWCEITEDTIDADAVLSMAESASAEAAMTAEGTDDDSIDPSIMSVVLSPDIRRIAVAMDEAFCFYYRENLRLMVAAGIRFYPFSPIHDKAIPRDVDALLMGGGYPEEYLEGLSDNSMMKASIREFHDNGGYIMAECGGFMYLHDAIEDKQGRAYPMAGIIPGSCRWTGRPVRFGYIELHAGQYGIRGHEFHYYDSDNNGEDIDVSKPSTGSTYKAMYHNDRMLAGFPHLYYPSLSVSRSGRSRTGV